MQIGLVGKPSSGKSSFFKAATMIDVAIADYPFTTIKPNVGMGYVVTDCACKYYDVKCNPKNSVCVNKKRYIPVKLIDVAGLVPDAHLGKGLGNQFLDDLRQASCLIHIVDSSGLTDAEGKRTTDHDPCGDIVFLTREIDLWLTSIIKKGMSRYTVKKKFSKVDLAEILTKQLTGLGINKMDIQQGLDKVGVDSTEDLAIELRSLSKPIIIAANKIDLPSSEKNLKKMEKKFPSLTVIPTSAASEIALRNAKEKGLIEYETSSFTIKDESKMSTKQVEGLRYIEKNVLEEYGSTGIQECLNKAVFDVLDHIVVYPVADINKLTDKKKNVLPDAFLVKNGTTLKEFAFSVHSDIGEKFIGGLEAKTKRKLGADYILQNNDVIEILFQKR